MTLGDLERRDATGQIFQANLLNKLVPCDLERPNLTGKHTLREERMSRSTPPHSNGAGPQRSPILGVLLYLCLHPLTHNDKIWLGNTSDERRDFIRSATPLYLHKCVAWFVGDS